jgi:NAD(P)-dependent dehydrogenase (short-subunit alcohol dehydrogenase family)
VLDINLKSPFWLTQACLPLLKKVSAARKTEVKD